MSSENKKYNQAAANEKWEVKNREHSNYLKARSSARSFINNKSTLEDLLEFESLINERRNIIEKIPEE